MSRRTTDELLSARRADVEEALRSRVAADLEEYGTGFRVHCVALGDVHPPVEVVPAFRDVVSALEEKEARINQAEAYRSVAAALARGQAAERLKAAEGFELDRTERAAGEAERFAAVAAANAEAGPLSRLRMYLETLEETLPGRPKVVLDPRAGQARRWLLLGPNGLQNLLNPKPAPPTEPAASDTFPPPEIPRD
jgi:regulator of protease activity HflC (stomatin/prohibitin superfamily)